MKRGQRLLLLPALLAVQALDESGGAAPDVEIFFFEAQRRCKIGKPPHHEGLFGKSDLRFVCRLSRGVGACSRRRRMNGRAAQQKVAGDVVSHQDRDVGRLQRASDGINAELEDIGDVVGVTRGFTKIKQDPLLVIFSGRGAFTQIRKNFEREKKMTAVDQGRNDSNGDSIGTRMQTIEKAPAIPSKQNAEHDGAADKFNEQDGFHRRQPRLVFQPPLPVTPEEPSSESRNDPHM